MNWPLLQNSLLVAGMTTALAVVFGLIAAVWAAGLPVRWRNGFLALAIVAIALPPFLVTNCWIHLLGETGVLRAWVPFRIYSLGGTVWILSLMLWPITLFAVWSAWRRLEAAQFECDPALTSFALFRWLLLPAARGELLLASVLTFVLALNNFAVPAILQTKVLPDEVWIRFNTQFDALGALKLSVPLVMAPLLLLALFARRGVAWPRLAGAVSPRVVRRHVGPGWFAACGVAAAVMCLSAVAAPLAQIAFTPRTWLELGGAVRAGTGAIWHSFGFAALAASVVMVVAVVASFRSSRRKEALTSRQIAIGAGRGKRMSLLTSAATGLVWLPFFIPGVLLGIALIWLFNRSVLVAFYQSAGIVVLALTIRYFALGWTAARHALRSTDPDLADAARLEGASRWQMWRHVWWPQTAPQLAAVWYVIYLLCLWDVESVVLIVPPGGETLALRIFNLLHYGHAGQVNALCLVLLGLAVLPLVGWMVWKCVKGKTSNIQHRTSNIESNSRLNTKNQKPKTRETPNTKHTLSEHRSSRRQSALVGIFDSLLQEHWLAAGFAWSECAKPVTDRHSALLHTTPQATPREGTRPTSIAGATRESAAHTRPARPLIGVWRLGFLWCLVFGVWCFTTGCSPSYGPGETRLRSQIFERAFTFGTRGVGIGEFNKPRSIAVDAEDNIYAVDLTGRVQKFSPRGEFLLSWQMPETDLGVAKGMGRDRAGNIIVIEPHYQRVNHYAPDGALVAQWGCRGTMPGCFTLPRAVAANSRGELVISEYMGAERVQKFRVPSSELRVGPESRVQRPESRVRVVGQASSLPVSGRQDARPTIQDMEREDVAQFSVDVAALGKPVALDETEPQSRSQTGAPILLQVIGKAGTGPGEFNRPEGVAVDIHDRIYVADSCNHRIQIFSADGKFIRQYGRAGTGLGELSYPYDIAVDARGYQFVCEFGNSRIQVFNAECEPVEIIGGPGTVPGRFSNPWAVALDSQGNLVVADGLNHRVQKLVRKMGPIGQMRPMGAVVTKGDSRVTHHASR